MTTVPYIKIIYETTSFRFFILAADKVDANDNR